MPTRPATASHRAGFGMLPDARGAVRATAADDFAVDDFAVPDVPLPDNLVGADLAAPDLAGADLAGEDLAAEAFAGEDLSGAVFAAPDSVEPRRSIGARREVPAVRFAAPDRCDEEAPPGRG